MFPLILTGRPNLELNKPATKTFCSTCLLVATVVWYGWRVLVENMEMKTAENNAPLESKAQGDLLQLREESGATEKNPGIVVMPDGSRLVIIVMEDGIVRGFHLKKDDWLHITEPKDQKILSTTLAGKIEAE